MEQREGVELLVLAMLFGASTDPRFHRNQKRLSLLSEQTIAYQGDAEVIEQEVAQSHTERSQNSNRDDAQSLQPRLL